MNYNIVLTTAEDIFAVVDSVVAKGSEGATKDFVSEFTGIATCDQVEKALQMAIELSLIEKDESKGIYISKSFLAKKLVSTASDEQKAVIMRLILEEYVPYKTFKERYCFTKSIDLACSQIKALHSLTANERDIKNTLISIATYAKALKSEGANLYSFTEESSAVTIIESIIQSASMSEQALREFFGEQVYTTIDKQNVFQVLSQAFQKTLATPIDARSIIVHSANAFESFLNDFAVKKSISLAGKSGIIQKKDALSSCLSKKHRGMIDFIGQIRNAADHGTDQDENNQIWNISNETALLFPYTVAIIIKDICKRECGVIEV